MAVVALAGPAWDKEETSLYESLEAAVFVFDLSLSMQSIDLKPNRLEQARYKAIEIIEQNDDRAIGLVVFAGSAFDVTPVSDDIATVTHLLQSLQVSMMPIQGSLASEGLSRAVNLLQNSGYKTGSIVLITDGVDRAAASEAERIKNMGYRVSVIGVGTTSGGPIEVEAGEFLKDNDGEIILVHVDQGSLTDVATAGGGKFFLISMQDSEQKGLIKNLGRDKFKLDENVQATTVNWKDRGPIFLLILVPMVALLFRRGWLFGFGFLLIGTPNQSEAIEWGKLWQRSDQRAQYAVVNEEFDDPSLLENSQWNGIANYRQERYDEAGLEFRKHDDKVSLYNFGNTLAKLGNLEGAIEKYEEAIEIDSEFEDALFNLDLIKRILENRQSKGEQGQDEGKDQGAPRNDQSLNDALEGMPPNVGEKEKQGLQKEGDVNSSSGQQRMGNERSKDENFKLAQASSEDKTKIQSEIDEELSQVMEQWMRQIPDDPGGLLRRKFHYEFSERMQRLPPSQQW